MTPDQERITELEKQVAELTRWAEQFQNAAQVDAQIARTIRTIATGALLSGLSDVSLSSPSNGQVLKYNGSVWVNGTDNV